MADSGALKLTWGHEARGFTKIESDLISNSSTKGLTNPPAIILNELVSSELTHQIWWKTDEPWRLGIDLEPRKGGPLARSATGRRHSTQREGNGDGDWGLGGGWRRRQGSRNRWRWMQRDPLNSHRGWHVGPGPYASDLTAPAITVEDLVPRWTSRWGQPVLCLRLWADSYRVRPFLKAAIFIKNLFLNLLLFSHVSTYHIYFQQSS
jgi:hypothetical protein